MLAAAALVWLPIWPHLADLAMIFIAWPDSPASLGDKFRTVYGLAVIAAIVALGRRWIFDQWLRLWRHRSVEMLLCLVLLIAPATVFYVAGARALRAPGGVLFWAGLLLLVVLLTFVSVEVLCAASRRRWLGVLLIPGVWLYLAAVSSVSALYGIAGEADLGRYARFLRGADLSWLFTPRILLPSAGVIIGSALVISRVQGRLRSDGTCCDRAHRGAVAVLLLVCALDPIEGLARLTTLSARELDSSLSCSEARRLKAIFLAPASQLPPFRREEPAPRYSRIPEQFRGIARKFRLLEDEGPTPAFRPFRRIVLITVESLSAEFTAKGGSTRCSQTLMPRLNRLMREHPSGLLWTAAMPTMNGLSALFSSHPNAALVMAQGYPNSFVRRLREDGFRTVFLRSDPEKYADSDILFRQAGFETMQGRDYFARDPRFAGAISDWGLEDRQLYRYAADFIASARDEKLFVHILPADTHGPSGRGRYTFPYPDSPEARCSSLDWHHARAYFRQDVDLGAFVDALKARGALTDDLLVVITGDHASPGWRKPLREPLPQVPLVVIASRDIPGLHLSHPDSSQLDLAPTILRLAGTPIPWGYFGRPLFDAADRTSLGMHGREIVVRHAGGTERIDVNEPGSGAAATLRDLTSSVFTREPHAPPAPGATRR